MNYPLMLTFLLFGTYSFAQQHNNLELPTSINDSGSSPDASAILDVQSLDKGMLVPRMSTTQRDQIDNPANGLLVYDIDTHSFWYWSTGISDWLEIDGAGGGSAVWSNSGGSVYNTNSGTVGIGTGNNSTILNSNQDAKLVVQGRSSIASENDLEIMPGGSNTSSTLLLAGSITEQEGIGFRYDGTNNDLRFLNYRWTPPLLGFPGFSAYSNTPLMTMKRSGYIGILTDDPQATFHVNGVSGDAFDLLINSDANSNGDATILMAGSSGYTEGVGIRYDDYSNELNFIPYTGGSFGDAQFSLDRTTARIGIGTTAPNARLHINATSTDENALRIQVNDNSKLTVHHNGGVAIGGYLQNDNPPVNGLYVAGNVSVGSNSPKPGYALSINGKAVAEEVLVQNSANWPDYVFAPEYKLRSLEEVEEYIAENQHLPEIPSAKAIQEEGIAVAEMHKLQMKKIEELTLYIIELKKEIECIKTMEK